MQKYNFEYPEFSTLTSNTKRDNYIKIHYPEFYKYLCDNYSHLPVFNERLYWFYNNITTQPVCKMCGGHPYNENDPTDIKRLESWQTHENSVHAGAAYVWGTTDVLKRNLAKENKLNYLEIFASKLSKAKLVFEEYIRVHFNEQIRF